MEFKMRVVRNIGIGSESSFGKPGTIHIVRDGEFTDLNETEWCINPNTVEHLNNWLSTTSYATEFELVECFESNVKDIVTDNVNHPKHYTSGKYECIDVIEDWGLGYCLGNAIKYICRHDKKGTPREDIDKAIWYLERYKESL